MQMRENSQRIHRAFAMTRNLLVISNFWGLQQDLNKLLAWELTNDPFHLQVEERSENLG